MKNKRDHLLPLSPIAVETIKAAIDEDEFLFPSRLNNRPGPMDRHTLSKAMARFAEELKEPNTWRKDPPTPHDLRRTVATRLARMGIAKEVRERVLNHAGARHDPEAKHYNLYEFLPEKREALDRWAAEVSALIGERR